MSDTLRERVAKAIWDAEIAEVNRGEKEPTKYAAWPADSARQPYCRWAYRAADIVVAAFTPEPAASETDLERAKRWLGHGDVACERDTSIECLAAEFAQLRAEKDREADVLIELALRMMDAYHMSGEIGIANIPTVASVRAAVKREGGS